MTISPAKPRPCQAKNPATCRVHGTFDPNTAILNHKVLKDNITDTEKRKKTATSIVELEEINEQMKQDEELYYQSLQGLEELAEYIRTNEKLTAIEKIKLRNQLAEAYEGRRNRLEQQTELKPLYDNYKSFIAEQAAEETFSPNSAKTDEEKQQILQQLQNIEPGTPLAVKTKLGAIIYDTAGHGLIEGANPNNLLNKMVKRGFMEPFSKDDYREAAISFTHSNTYMNIGYVQEITVLKPGTFDNGVPSQLKPAKGSEVDLEKSHSGNHVYGVEGENYYYQMNSPIRTQVSKKGKKEHALSEHLSYVAPTSVKKITQIV